MSRDPTWWRYDPAARRLTLTLHAQPGAKKSQIVGVYGDALKVKIAAPAADYKANTALLEFLSETLGVSKSTIVIRHGAAARRKVIEISGGPELVTIIASVT